MPHCSAIDDPVKPFRHLFSPRSKYSSYSTANLVKFVFLAICAAAFLSFCYFSISTGSKCGFSAANCERNIIHSSFHEINGSSAAGETTISHILFGIGGSAGTWSRRREICELWWKPNVSRGFVWIDNEPLGGAQGWPATSPPYRVSADTAAFRYTSWGPRAAVRIARIVKESFELGLDGVRWFVMGDDDSIFFTDNLVTVLNKYDHRQMYYIGGNSESVEQNIVHSYSMGYGGGGFAVSYPLAAQLVRILDGCINRYAEMYGSDQKVGACMAEIGVPLTRELGFHQLDIRGSPYGILSTHPLAPLVSLHHLDYLQPLFPGTNRVESIKKLVQAYKPDPTRILQHTFCYDLTRKWSISVAWGYTVQVYPFLLTAKELNTPLQTFLTWGTWSQEPFTFDTRPMALEPCERPVLFYLDGEVQRSRDGRTTASWYPRSRAVRWKECEREHYKAAYVVKGFNITADVLDPKYYYNAPRRQCCEITSGLEQGNGVVQLRIRDCSEEESVTIPF
ncbi:uncharacterized protein LOC127251041 [Andrographis paniculata]|uniref:uncharacterized protein LOC127251041 n=1 Tax=Andrographis paniculata TaxID=175694 RepID=UPI0021E7B03E|nr:uncharacterized protein LOC127251041 [Andrographis paniculata]